MIHCSEKQETLFQTWQKAKTDTFSALFVCVPFAYGINRCTPSAILSNCPPLPHPCMWRWRHIVCVVRAGKWEETEKWILENGAKNKLEIIGTKHQYPAEPGSFQLMRREKTKLPWFWKPERVTAWGSGCQPS